MANNTETALAKVLADTYVLTVKTQNYHWNVEGMEFYQLHKLFEEQYNELPPAIDELAERLRALGHRAPGSMKEFLALTTLNETSAKSAKDMIADLKAANEGVTRSAQAAKQIAQAAGDDETVDLMVRRIQLHDKNSWFLGSLLK